MTLLRTTARLARHEIKRLLRPSRVIWILGPPIGLGIHSLTIRYSRVRVMGSLTIMGSTWLPLAVPLVAGSMAFSMAEDRRRCFALMVLARGVSRNAYLLSKVLGAAISSSLTMLAVIAAFY